MIVFIIKPILLVHVSTLFPPTIYYCIKATMDLPSRIKPRRVERFIIVDDTIDLITPVKSKTLALIDAKDRMRLKRTRRQLFSSTRNNLNSYD